MHTIEDLQILFHFSQFVKDPRQTERIFKINDITRFSPRYLNSRKVMMNKCLLSKGFKRQLDEKFLPQKYTKDNLSHYPEGSLGKALFKHYDKNQIDVDFFPEVEINKAEDYLIFRLYQLHDIWHVLTGYGTDVIDEMALQAFTFSQIESGGNMMIMAAGLLHVGKESPERQKLLLEKMFRGFEMGKGAMSLFEGAPLENRFNESLNDLRAEYNIQLSNQPDSWMSFSG